MTVTWQTPEARFNADDNRWESAKEIIGDRTVTLGPQASQQWLDAPDHLAMVLARYRAAAALIGGAERVLEVGCGEGIGAGILAKGRRWYCGIDTDTEAIAIARSRQSTAMQFCAGDGFSLGLRDNPLGWPCDAIVLLDVIEHVPPSPYETRLGEIALANLGEHGVCVVGTPSKHAEHLASPQSRAGHVNLYTPDRLRALLTRHFHVVQMLYLQDTSLHLGHPEMAHYIMAVGIGPRRR